MHPNRLRSHDAVIRVYDVAGNVIETLGANMPLTEVTPIAFTLSDGVQTITNNGPGFVFFTSFLFATDASGTISMWSVVVETIHNGTTGAIVTNNHPMDIHDSGIVIPEGGPLYSGPTS